LGDSIASGLGVSPIRMRAFSLVIASLSVASVISFSGLLGFVGLVVPHITRKLVGAELKKQLTAAPIVGATLVILSDLFGRIILAPSEISVGIIMAFIGAPFFFILLLRRRMM
jgi:iron complex transport system permease protein